MRLQRYLNEKYVTSLKLGGYGEIIDVFKNPNSKELKEIQTQSFDEYGFRFIVDFEKKDVYIWSNKSIHRWIVDKNPQLFPNLKWNDYFMKADQADRYFTGHLEHGQIKSDVWRALAHRAMAGQFTPEEIGIFHTMQNNDKKWLSKYDIDPKAIQRMVDNVVRQYDKVQRRAS